MIRKKEHLICLWITDYRHLLLLLVLLLSSCTTYRFPLLPPEKKMSREDIARHRAQDYFIKARDYDRRGLSQMAESFYKMALELDPESEVLKRLVIKKYIETQKYTQALVLLRSNNKPQGEYSSEEKALLVEIYIKLQRFEDAAHIIESFDELSPDKIYSLAFLYESSGKFEKALGYYYRFYQETKKSLDIGLKISSLLMKLGQFEAVDLFLDTLESDFGTSAQLFNLEGIVKLARKDTSAAIKSFRLSIETDTSYEEPIQQLAQIYIQKNNLAEAIVFYEKLYKSSNWGELYGKTLGMLYYYESEYEKANQLFRKLLADNIGDYELHYFLGLVSLELGDADMARLEFEKTIALRNTFTDAWRQLCYLPIKDKNWQEAEKCAKRFTETLPDQALGWRIMGSIFNAKKEYKKAVPAFLQSLALDSTDAFAWFELGSAYERQNNIDKAASSFSKVLSLKPGDPVAANYLGYMWAEHGKNLDSAQKLIELALSTDPDNGAYLDSYAWVFFQQNQLDTAYKYIKKAIDVIDNDPIVFEHYGDILARKGKIDKAIHSYQKALSFAPDNKLAIISKIKELERQVQETPNQAPLIEPDSE